MSGEEYQLKCECCGKTGYIVSVEIITEAFPVYVNSSKEIECDGSNGKVWHSEREHYMCLNCDTIYHDEDDLHDMMVDSKGNPVCEEE